MDIMSVYEKLSFGTDKLFCVSKCRMFNVDYESLNAALFLFNHFLLFFPDRKQRRFRDPAQLRQSVQPWQERSDTRIPSGKNI